VTKKGESWSLGAGLEGKGVIVTGAGGGIGRAIVQAFDMAGARICAVDRQEGSVGEVVAGLNYPERHLAMGVDLADLRTHADLFASAQRTLGRVDVLAHAAAMLRRRSSVMEITEEDWDLQLNMNLKATFFLNMKAATAFRNQGRGGRIINFVSTSWWTGGTSVAIPYAASKSGVVSMSRSLAKTFAKDGITVNTLAPGGVDTPMMREGLTQDQLDAYIATIPMGRLASPAEIAGSVVFLASDHASYISGATLNVSGAQLLY
jgi:NAD(P)-dependent dehydrogenase (short-subunit alcohol dehydrogenase family)